MKYKRILLKLSGEAFIGDKNYGIDPERLQKYCEEIKEIHALGVELAVVIGGGNTAVEEALYLSNIASKVILVHRRDQLRAEAMLVDKLNQKIETKKIEIIWNATLSEINGDNNKVTSVNLNKNDTNDQINIECSGVFIAIGHEPNTKLFQKYLD